MQNHLPYTPRPSHINPKRWRFCLSTQMRIQVILASQVRERLKMVVPRRRRRKNP